jgi:hypothetical protein
MPTDAQGSAPRCEAMHDLLMLTERGTMRRCTLPAGHEGEHEMLIEWATPAGPPPAPAAPAGSATDLGKTENGQPQEPLLKGESPMPCPNTNCTYGSAHNGPCRVGESDPHAFDIEAMREAFDIENEDAAIRVVREHFDVLRARRLRVFGNVLPADAPPSLHVTPGFLATFDAVGPTPMGGASVLAVDRSRSSPEQSALTPPVASVPPDLRGLVDALIAGERSSATASHETIQTENECATARAALDAALAALVRRVEEAERDAERYRFLRDNPMGFSAVDGNASAGRLAHRDVVDRWTDEAGRVAMTHTPSTIAQASWPVDRSAPRLATPEAW